MKREDLINKLTRLALYLQKSIGIPLEINCEFTESKIVGVITTAHAEINVASIVFTFKGEAFLYYSDNDFIRRTVLNFNEYRITPGIFCIVGNGGNVCQKQ